jgi:hypothetical protein
MWRSELYNRFKKIESELKRLGIISKSTLWHQKRKVWLKANEANLHQYFSKSSGANKGRHNVHWRSKG